MPGKVLFDASFFKSSKSVKISKISKKSALAREAVLLYELSEQEIG